MARLLLQHHTTAGIRPALVHVARGRAELRDRRVSLSLCRAGNNGSFDTSQYFEAWVQNVRVNEGSGPAMYLKLKDGGDGAVLTVYVGEAECSALVKEINHRHSSRPLTHDLFKNAFEVVGCKVVLVRIHSLVGNTYHARIHLQRQEGGPTIDIDARPSDAVNLAVRFNAPIYVSKAIAAKMAYQDVVLDSHHMHHIESHAEIARSCKAEVLKYQDPTIMHNLQLQLAIQEERYEDASDLRDQIEKIISQDQSLRLVVAIETALEDGRYEEAAKLRDELHNMRKVGSHRQLYGDAGL